jgi:hypothetical protein
VVDGNGVEIGTNGSAKLTIDQGGQVTLTGDLNAAGGNQVNYTFFRNNVLQGTFPHMTSSFLTGGFGAASVYLRQPLRKNGSIVGITIYTEDATVKSGSLSASVTINGSTVVGASTAIPTGTIVGASFAKDTYSFSALSTLGVQFSASTGYFTDKDPLSGSWLAVVTVEM